MACFTGEYPLEIPNKPDINIFHNPIKML